MDVGNTTISSSSNAICLRVAWSHDLSPTVNISNNLAKARRAVFEQQANGIAYGKQNPLTSRQLYSVCVHPVCLYSSESWLLRESTLATLEKFQGDHGKKILNIPKHHSNLIPLVALKWPTMRLCRKNTQALDHSAVQVPGKTARNSLHASHREETVLTLKSVSWKRKIAKYIWEQGSSRESLAALTPDINWLKLWDDARDNGLPGTRALEATLLILTTPKYENYSCHICGHIPDSSQSPAHHIGNIHFCCSADQLRESLTGPSEETFTLAASLRATFSLSS